MKFWNAVFTAPDPRIPLRSTPAALKLPETSASNAAPWPFPKFAIPAPKLSAKPVMLQAKLLNIK